MVDVESLIKRLEYKCHLVAGGYKLVHTLFKTNLSLGDTYILVNGTITVRKTGTSSLK